MKSKSEKVSPYEILRSLPLFHGVSYRRLEEMAGKVRLHFLKYSDGQEIIGLDEQSTHLICLLSGSARMYVDNRFGRFGVEQTLSAPDVIAPSYLFGGAPRYPFSVKSLGETSLVKIEKGEYLKILQSDQVFMLNMLNSLSMTAQKASEGLLGLSSSSLAERLAYWVIALTQPRATDIVLTCRKRDLYTLLGVSRSMFMQTLDEMSARGLITYDGDGNIIFNDRRSLLELIHDN